MIHLALIATIASAQTPVERDSAGIRIVENPARATAPVVFRLGARTASIGGPADNPDDEFRRGWSYALRMSDGSIAMPDRDRVQFFSVRGERAGIFGRAGAGPEEFSSLGALEFCRTRGDTLVAGDNHNGRTAIIHARKVVRTVPLSVAYGGSMVGCFDDGTFLMRGGLPNFRTPTYTIRLNRLRLDGTHVNEIGKFDLQAPSAVTRLHNATVKAWGQRVYIGDGANSEIRVYRANGKLTHIIRSADPPQRVSAADAEKNLAGTAPSFRQFATIWRPETWPAYSTFYVDPEGRLWVGSYVWNHAESPNDVWTAFDTSGHLIGRLEVPRKLDGKSVSVLAFGNNEVQLRWIDADGFVHLSFHALTR